MRTEALAITQGRGRRRCGCAFVRPEPPPTSAKQPGTLSPLTGQASRCCRSGPSAGARGGPRIRGGRIIGHRLAFCIEGVGDSWAEAVQRIRL